MEKLTIQDSRGRNRAGERGELKTKVRKGSKRAWRGKRARQFRRECETNFVCPLNNKRGSKEYGEKISVIVRGKTNW